MSVHLQGISGAVQGVSGSPSQQPIAAASIENRDTVEQLAEALQSFHSVPHDPLIHEQETPLDIKRETIENAEKLLANQDPLTSRFFHLCTHLSCDRIPLSISSSSMALLSRPQRPSYWQRSHLKPR